MTRRLIATAFVGLLLTSVVIPSPTIVSAQEAAAPAQPAAPVQRAPVIRVAVAEKREMVDRLSVNGTIVARDEASVGTDLSGMIVIGLEADIGDIVKKGQLLAKLDRSMLDTQLAEMRALRLQAEATAEQMQAQIGEAEVAARQALRDLERARALRERGVAAQSQLDNANSASEAAQARLVSATKGLAATRAQLGVIDAQIDRVLVQIGKTEVKAPADGLVLARAASVGAVVSAGSGALFRIAIDGDLELEAQVAEVALPTLAKGMTADVVLPGAPKSVEGTLRRIAPEIDQRSRLGPIRIALPAGSPARVGSFARAEIEIARREGVAVPSAALVYRDGEAFVQAVDNGTIRTTKVEVGLRAGKYVEILSGLEAGQEVVARAGTFVADGDRVEPVRDEQTGALTP
jgi:HlyD family secretion protein